MCKEQQYLAIDPPPERKLLNISHELPIGLVLKCMSDERVSLSRIKNLLHPDNV